MFLHNISWRWFKSCKLLISDRAALCIMHETAHISDSQNNLIQTKICETSKTALKVKIQEFFLLKKKSRYSGFIKHVKTQKKNLKRWYRLRISWMNLVRFD